MRTVHKHFDRGYVTPQELHRSSLQRGLAYLRSQVNGVGLQIGYSTDPAMAHDSILSHTEVLRAELPEGIAKRMSMFGEDIREALTSGMALKLISCMPTMLRCELVDYVYTHQHGENGRFRYYAGSDSIAPCIDTTGICLVGLWRANALDKELLHKGAIEQLKAAAAESVEPETNISHGGENGALEEGVLKIYWDDHPDGPMRRRGRKHDAVVVCDGLHAVLLAAKEANLNLEELEVPLFEYRADHSVAEGQMNAAAIVCRNIDWLRHYMETGLALEGTTYYGCPSFLLSLLVELFLDGGEWAASLEEPIHNTLHAWWSRLGTEQAHPLDSTALGLAGGLLASKRLGLRGVDFAFYEGVLSKLQLEDGSWPAAPWYRMRTQPMFFGNAASTTVFAVAALGASA
ncbi:MAG: hypothetical protein EP343_02355 [Deltaproteobacteria bacterium]|nr:MAG: hypothetical protein EP343_02355 [Deltaproteobacteria bacterium]